MRTTTLRSCNDKFQQFAGWAATSAENRLVPQVQFLGRLSCPLCNDSSRLNTVQITVGVPQLQFSWVVQFLDKIVYMPAVVHFFDKVVDVPVVLCNGVPQVQFIDGYDVPVIMRGQRSAPHLADCLRTRLGVRIVPASCISSELSAHQMAPAGVIAHSGPHFQQALFLSSLSSFVSPLLPLGVGFLLARGNVRSHSCCRFRLQRSDAYVFPYGFAWYYSNTPYYATGIRFPLLRLLARPHVCKGP